jgi:hypothetical protein
MPYINGKNKKKKIYYPYKKIYIDFFVKININLGTK